MTVRPTTPDGGSAAQPRRRWPAAPIVPAHHAAGERSRRHRRERTVRRCDGRGRPSARRRAARRRQRCVPARRRRRRAAAAGRRGHVARSCPFTGHCLRAHRPAGGRARRSRARRVRRGHPSRALLRVAGGGAIGSLDVVLVRRGSWGIDTARRAEPTSSTIHVSQRARHHRRDVRVLGDERGFVTIGRGLVDRIEMSVELLDHAHGHGRRPPADRRRVCRAIGRGRAGVRAGRARQRGVAAGVPRVRLPCRSAARC